MERPGDEDSMSDGLRRLLSILAVTIAIAGVSVGLVRGCGQRRQVLHVLAADALAVPFQQAVELFEREQPDVEVNVTVEGSVMLLRMQLLHPADVVALADHRLIEEGLRPDDAEWLIKFATTEVVVARTQASKYADEITSENWVDVLMRPDVLVAHPDPSSDSCGYYTRLAWKLAENHYKAQPPGLYERLLAKSPPKLQRPDALTVLALLESRAVDYAFVYRCHAEAHHLAYTRLPDTVGLGSLAKELDYAAAEVEVPDFKGRVAMMKGHPIFFALAVSRHSRRSAAAERFVAFILSARGRELLRRAELNPLATPKAPAWSTGMPQALRNLVEVESPAAGPGK